MFPTSHSCDECKPGGHGLPGPTTFFFSSLPLVVTFLIVFAVAQKKLFPLLSGREITRDRDASRWDNKRVAAVTFSTTIGMATVLIELILCEISNSIDASVRSLALCTVVSLLLFLLVLALPSLEIQSVIEAAGYEFTGSQKGCLRLAWVLQLLATASWLGFFWWSGAKMLGSHSSFTKKSINEASLERVGVIGISFMALLSGFASISAPWQNFVSRPRLVSELDLVRKEAGLNATHDMLSAKQSRLRALERKLAERPTESYFKKALGSIRPNADLNELRTLELEIKGLETMAATLSTSHDLLRSRYTQQQHSKTSTGRLWLAISYGFSLFCLYRIFTVAYSAFRRHIISSNKQRSNTGSDPVTSLLALLAKHYDPTLDQAVYSRQISLLLSFLILAASFSSVLQTLSLFSRFFPSLLHTLRSNLPLIVAQLCATYVISAALMLRGMIPGSVLEEGVKNLGLGGGEMGWVDSWFEGWFLTGVGLTALGVYWGRKLGGEDWEDGEEADLEGGKRS